MKKKIYIGSVIALSAITVILNILALNRSFCDAFIDKFMVPMTDPIARVTDKIPFLLIEVFIFLGILLNLMAFVLLIVLIIFRKRKGVRNFAKAFYKFFLIIIIATICDNTVFDSVTIHSSVLGNDYSPVVDMDTEEIRTIRNYVVNELNKTAYEVPRDEEYHLIFPSVDELNSSVIQGMKSLGDEYPRLEGFYPRYKETHFSDILKWMGIGAQTYYLTKEIRISKYEINDRLYLPVLYAHESAHLRNFTKESEADFIGYMGCINSDNVFVRYAGLIKIYKELDEAFSNSTDKMSQEEFTAMLAGMTNEEKEQFFLQTHNPEVDQIVFDDISGEYERYADAYKNEEHPYEAFEDIINEIGKDRWEEQEKTLGVHNYDGSTALLLQYYREKLHTSK